MYGCATTAAGPEPEVYVHTCMAVQQAAGPEREMDVHTCMAVQQQQWT